jgi:hypothetical protein
MCGDVFADGVNRPLFALLVTRVLSECPWVGAQLRQPMAQRGHSDPKDVRGLFQGRSVGDDVMYVRGK